MLHGQLMFTGYFDVYRSHCIKVCIKLHTKSLSLQVALMFTGHIKS